MYAELNLPYVTGQHLYGREGKLTILKERLRLNARNSHGEKSLIARGGEGKKSEVKGQDAPATL